MPVISPIIRKRMKYSQKPFPQEQNLFKYSNLRKFFHYLKEHHKVIPLRDWNGSNRTILRHDVDFDIKPAYDLAMIENEYEIRSTFFIMTTTNTYNPMTMENRTMLKEMSSLGFEIGLHFDPLIYGETTRDELTERVEDEAAILSSITNEEVRSISLHNPSVHNNYILFEGYMNAYDKRIFSPDRYISDSRMIFSKDIFQFLEKAETSTIQVLLHPLHYSKEGKDYSEIFNQFVHDFVGKIDTNFRVKSTYANLIKKDLFQHIFDERSKMRKYY